VCQEHAVTRWIADAINTVVYLINKGPLVPLNCGIPEKAWTNKKVNMKRGKLEAPACFLLYLICPCGARSRKQVGSRVREMHFHWYGISEYDYRFWDPENRKILRHMDVVFNEVYKDLLTRSTSDKDPGVTRRSSPEQQDAADLEFVELDVSVKKVRSIPGGN